MSQLAAIIKQLTPYIMAKAYNTENKIEKIVYISCNPATLARDLELLKDDYKIGEIYPVDMFPFTIHTECVTVLDHK